MAQELTWKDTNKIGITLSNTHPQIEPDTVALNDLHGYVIGLVEFKGDPAHFDELYTRSHTRGLEKRIPGTHAQLGLSRDHLIV